MSRTPTATPTGSRADRRKSIVDAAFEVFARRGYPQAGVDEIAAEAGVAKATVYNHFGDKETLLREAIATSADATITKNLDVIAELTDTGADPRPRLEKVGARLIDCYCDDRSMAVRRLLYAELAAMPDLIDIVYDRSAERVRQALADRLARLAVAGRLRLTDPLEAADQLSALLTGTLEQRTRMGTRPLSPAQRRDLARTAVSTFLAGYGVPAG